MLEKRIYEFVAHSRTKGELICSVHNYVEDLTCSTSFRLIEVRVLLQMLYHHYRSLDCKFHYIQDNTDSTYYVESRYISENRIHIDIYDFLILQRLDYSTVTNHIQYWQQYFLEDRQSTTPAFLPLAIEYNYAFVWYRILVYTGKNGVDWVSICPTYHVRLEEVVPDYEDMFNYFGNLLDLYLPALNMRYEHEWYLEGLI